MVMSPMLHLMIAEPPWLLLVIAVLATLTGLAVSGLASRAGVDSSSSVRLGIRGSAIAAIAAGCVFALMARSLPGTIPVSRALLGGLLSIMPASLCGTVAAGVATRLFAQRTSSIASSATNSRLSTQVFIWGLRALIGSLTVAAILLPPGEFPKPKPSPVIDAVPVIVAPPPFAYAIPSEMATAHALQWNFRTSQDVAGVRAGTVILSQDDRWLGYVSSRDTSLHALQLNSPTLRRSATLPHEVDRLSFSPNAESVFVAAHLGQTEIGVADLLSGRYIALPKPRNRAMPDGKLSWWKDNEVLIVGQNGNRWILNLDTLEVDDADSVESWNATEPAHRSSFSGLAGSLRDSPRWAWERVMVPKSVALPEELGSTDWQIGGARRLAIQHPERDARRVFDMISVEDQDELRSTRDGSKVIRIRGDTASILYFDIGKAPPFKWTITMPHSPTEGPDAARIETALKDGTLCAFVYGRVTNPLNNKLVGPDRDDILGSVNVLEWKDKMITVYVSGYDRPLDVGCIVADLHIHSDQRHELLKLNTPHRWWAELSTAVPDSDKITAIPSRADKLKQFAAVRDAERQAAKDKDAAEGKARESEAARQQQVRLEAGRKASQPESTGDPVKDFIIAHHRKSQRGDAEGMAADYADRVDYFTDGLVDVQHILKDELQYHSTHRVEEEFVQGDIRVTRLKNGFTATYLIKTTSFDLQKNTLKEGVFEENLIIIESPTGLKIARQRVEKKL